MRVLLTSWILAYLLGNVAPPAPVYAKTPEGFPETTRHLALELKDVRRKVGALKQSNKSEDYSQIGKILNERGVADGKEDAHRKLKLRLWLRVLETIRTRISSEWKQDAFPQPPLPPPGTIISAGAAPAAIRDPLLRAKYERELSDYTKELEGHQFQNHLRHCEEQFAMDLFVFVRSHFTDSREDRHVVTEIINEEYKNKDSVKALLDAFGELDNKFFVGPSGSIAVRTRPPVRDR